MKSVKCMICKTTYNTTYTYIHTYINTVSQNWIIEELPLLQMVPQRTMFPLEDFFYKPIYTHLKVWCILDFFIDLIFTN